MSLTLVLCVGFDPTLLNTRCLVLRSAGYMVVSASSLREAVERYSAGDFDLVILCYSVLPKDRERLACLIRASGSLTPIVSIAATPDQHDNFHNATLCEKDRKGFLDSLGQMLSRAARIDSAIAGIPRAFSWKALIRSLKERKPVSPSFNGAPVAGNER